MRADEEDPIDNGLVGERYFDAFLLWQRVCTAICIAIVVASMWLPLQPILHMVEALSGRETGVDLQMGVTLTLTIALPLSGVVAWQRIKIREQRAQLEDRRRRLLRLEQTVKDLRRLE